LLATACGHGDTAPGPSPAPGAGVSPTPPATPTPAPVPAPSAVPGGSAEARGAMLAALDLARTKKMRLRATMTTVPSPGSPARTFTSEVEAVPPDRQRMVMHMTPTMTTETVRIGTQAWMRMGSTGPWHVAPTVSVTVGTTAAASVIEESRRAIETGEVTVSAAGEEGGMHVFRLAGTVPGRGTTDARVWIGADGLPHHYVAHATREPSITTEVDATIEYDDTIAIEPPVPPH
jgi:hypothetical protein